jgi:alkyldihydroxyacetonephosphate synthase
MDHDQFILGQIIRPAGNWIQGVVDKLKQAYVSYIKKFNFEEIVVATLVFEGNALDVKAHEKLINEIASKYLGFPAGAANGQKGYTLTYIVVYVRVKLSHLTLV